MSKIKKKYQQNTFLHKTMRSLSANKGFTLIEVLAAVIILGMSYVAILQNFSISMRNINRIEIARTGSFLDMLSFEQLLRPPAEEENFIPEEYPLFMEGRVFQLVIVTDENENMTTLKLEKIYK
jgi:prepilin-type N-terminal cleavage/methylation domain-containing protein